LREGLGERVGFGTLFGILPGQMDELLLPNFDFFRAGALANLAAALRKR
jgi:hypothetical protein